VRVLAHLQSLEAHIRLEVHDGSGLGLIGNPVLLGKKESKRPGSSYF